MILESHVWKNELNKDLQTVKRRLHKAKISWEQKDRELATVSIEKFAFMSAFIVRKLIESKKLSDEFESMSVQVQEFRQDNLEPTIHFMNRHRIDKFYDLENGSKTALPVVKICHAFIHSFVFEIAIDNDAASIDGIFFNSDKTKDEKVYFIQLKNYLQVIETAIKDEIIQTHANPREGIYRKSRNQRKM